MRVLIALLALFGSLSALQTSEKLFECTRIFEERKTELLVELERIDEQKQALEALKAATDELLKKKEARLLEKEAEVEATLKRAEEKEKNTEAMLEANKKVLEEIKTLKMDRVTQTYSKMKAGSAAQILGGMDVNEAAKILMTLKPATTGKILSKMDAKKASEITLLLAKEPKSP